MPQRILPTLGVWSRLRELIAMLGGDWGATLSLGTIIQIARWAAQRTTSPVDDMVVDAASLVLTERPNIADSSACRQWLIRLTDIADDLADTTETTLDDTVIDAVESVITDDRTWPLLHQVIVLAVDRLDNGVDDALLLSSNDVAGLVETSNELGVSALDADWWLSIVSDLVKLIAWISDLVASNEQKDA